MSVDFETAAHIATAVAVILLLVKLIYTTKGQKKLFAAQLLRDRYQMFFDSWEVKDEDVEQFRNKVRLFVEIDKIDKDYLHNLL
jgi:hypothetical protein